MIRTKLGYLIMLFFFGLFAILYNEYVTMVLFYILCILPFVLWMIAWYAKRHVDISLETQSLVANKNETYEVTIHLVNQSILPVPKIKIELEGHNLFPSKKFTETIITALDGKSDVSLALSVTSEYCGMIEFKIHRIYCFDYLGIFKQRKKNKSKLYVTVLPKLQLITEPIVLENPNVLVDSELFSSVKSGDDPSELYGIREYEEGDKMNRIHWKLSLKQDELMVKQFGLPINCAVAVMVDWAGAAGRNDMERIDAMMETVLSLSISMILQNQIHYIVWYDASKELCQRKKIESEEDVYDTLRLLFRCRLSQEQTTSVVTYHEAQFFKEQYTNVFYIGNDVNEELVNQLQNARKSALMHLLLLHKAMNQEDMDKDYEQVMHELTSSASLLLAGSMGMKVSVLRIDHLQDDIANFV